MKIVFVTTKIPARESGSSVRNYYLLQALEKTYGKQVSLLFAAVGLDNDQIQTCKDTFRIPSYFVKIPQLSFIKKMYYMLQRNIPYLKHLQKAPFTQEIISMLMKTDVIIVEELDGYALIKPYLHLIQGKIILDAHNVDTKRFQAEVRAKSFPENIFGLLLFQQFTSFEIEAIKQCDTVFVCSAIDGQYFEGYSNKNNITIISNGVDCTEFVPVKTHEKNTLIFMGLLSYLPNKKGLEWYLHNIHPLVKRTIPSLKIYIIGKNPPQWLSDFAKRNPEVIVTGFVKDVREYLARGTICVCPLLDGSGTRLKILEYLAQAKPVVTTNIGAEGITVDQNKNIVIANTTDTFAKAIINLLHNPERAEHIGKKGRELVVKKYDWRLIQKAYINQIERIL